LTQVLVAQVAAGQFSPDFTWDETAFPEPLDARRRAQGKAYYEGLGIARGDKASRHEAMVRNLDFFGAPHAAFLFIPEFDKQGFLPSSPFLGALAYIRERRVGLSVYLDDPEVSIDANHLERALRVIPMGKKNWLFSWTELGAKTYRRCAKPAGQLPAPRHQSVRPLLGCVATRRPAPGVTGASAYAADLEGDVCR
jgi:hypothetical protein